MSRQLPPRLPRAAHPLQRANRIQGVPGGLWTEGGAEMSVRVRAGIVNLAMMGRIMTDPSIASIAITAAKGDSPWERSRHPLLCCRDMGTWQDGR